MRDTRQSGLYKVFVYYIYNPHCVLSAYSVHYVIAS